MISQQELVAQGRYHPFLRGGAHLQPDEKGPQHRQGYIAPPPPDHAAGGVNMDIGGLPGESLRHAGFSTPGVVRISLAARASSSLCRSALQDIRSLGSLQRKHVPTNGDGGRVFRSSSDELPASYDDLCKQKTFL